MTAKSTSARAPSGRHGKAKDKPKTKAVRLKRGQADERIPKILEAAAAEFVEQGFLSTRMEDIAARLGISKPIIYRHFPSKHALLQAVLDQQLNAPFDQLSEYVRNYAGPLKPLLQAIVARANPDMSTVVGAVKVFRLILSEGFRVPDFAERFFTTNLRPINETLQVLFRKAMTEGKMRKADPDFAARELVAPYFHGALIGAIMLPSIDFGWKRVEYLEHALESFCRSYEITE